MATIDNLTLEVKADVTKAAQSLNTLSTSLTDLKTNMSGVVGGYKTLAKELSKITVSATSIKTIRDIGKSLQTLNAVRANNITKTADNLKVLSDSIGKISLSKTTFEKIKQISNIGNSLAKLNSVSPAKIKNTADNLNSLQGAMANISYQAVDKIERLAKAFDKLSKAAESLKKFGPVKKIAKIASETQPLKGSDTETATSESGSGTLGKVKKETEQASGSLKGITKVLANVAGAFKKVLKPVTNFIKALGRIAFYRFIRSILKFISQAIQVGIQNIALYSKAMEGLDTHNANNVLSRYASEFLYLKNAVATAVIPILRGLIPIIETATNRIIDFINVLAQLGSAFFGTSFTKAKYFWADYADSLDNATGRAKALHHQLAQFDELNNLTAPSGGSGSDKLQDASKMFEEAVINEKIQNFIGKIKNGLSEIKAILSPTLEKLKEIWNGIKEKVAPNIKRIWENLKRVWAVVKPLVVEFAKGFLEGFFGQEFDSLPDALGKLSEKIADVSDNVADWFEKLDLEKLKDWANKIGKVTGAITFLLTPLGILLSYLDIQNSRLFQWGVQLGFVMGYNITKFVLDMKQAIEKAIEKIKDIYDKTVNLNDSSSVLSTNLKDLKDKFNDVKDKAKEFTDKLFYLINDIVDVKKKCEALRTYYKDHNLFENVIATGAMFLYTITQIESVLNALKKIGEIVVKLTISVANGSVLDDIINKIRSISNDAGHAIENALSQGKDNPNTQAQLPTSTPKPTNDNKKKTPAITGHSIARRALGGYVPRGDLFYANEMGAEMIGNIGGNTAVANNNQITEAIATATYNAMARALSENGQNVNIVVEGDGDKMFKVFQKKQRDWQRTTGLAY